MTQLIDQIFVISKQWLLGYVPVIAQPLVSAVLSIVPVLIAFPLLFAARIAQAQPASFSPLPTESSR